MATRQPAPLSYVLRTAQMRSEYKGGHEEGLELLFVSLPNWEARVAMLETLQAAHDKTAKHEAEEAAK